MPQEPIVDIFTRRPLSGRARRAAAETEAVVNGSIADRPVTIFVHLKGESDPFPRSWKWGKLVLDGGRPTWSKFKLKGEGDPIVIPPEALPLEAPRLIQRSELAFSCPNPRKARIIALGTGTTRLWLGVPRYNVDTVLAALAQTAPRSRERQFPPTMR
jgi:hypothetical protein